MPDEQHDPQHRGNEVPPTASGVAGLRLGRAFGIPIYIHASWLLVFGLFSWTLATGYFPSRDPELTTSGSWARAVVATLLFFGSVLLHELGHSLVAIRSGIPIHSITLFIFGGVARMEHDPESGREELRIAAAGPAVSLLLAGIFFAAAQPTFLGDAAQDIARYLAGINLAVALFNLVPAFPLDGGRLLRGLLWPSAGKLRATRAASIAGSVFAWALILVGALALVGGRSLAGVWYVLIGWFLKDAAAGAWRQARLDEVLKGLNVSEAMSREVDTVPSHVSVAEAARDIVLRTGHAWYPVIRGGELVGVLRLEDLLKMAPEDREGTSVQGVMRPLDPGLVVEPDAPLLQVLPKLSQAAAAQLLVVQEGQLVGRLAARDVVRLARVREQLEKH